MKLHHIQLSRTFANRKKNTADNTAARRPPPTGRRNATSSPWGATDLQAAGWNTRHAPVAL
eukprot:3523513-Lingulodinium_polyedra.AAC.1